MIDTNILISGLLVSTSLPAYLLTLWREGSFDLLISDAQLDELIRVIRYPKIRARITPALAGRLINDLRHFAVMVENLPFVDIAPDPDDNYLLAMASKGKADFLVTGDKRDLLNLGLYKGSKIISVYGFLSLAGNLP